MRRVRGVVGVAVLAMGMASCESATKPPVPVGFVALNITSQVLASGDSLQLELTVEDENGNPLSGRTVEWRSLDTTAVTVTPTGRVRAKLNRGVANVTTRVRATVEGLSAQADITVTPVPVATLTLTPIPDALEDGDRPILQFQARDATGALLIGRLPQWESRNAALVRVNSVGQLTPVPFLGATNRSTFIVGSLGAVRDSVSVSVVASSELDSIAILPEQPALRFGYTKKLRIVGFTPTGTRIEGLQATYSSGDPAVATISAAGLATASASTAGSTQVVASFAGFADTVSLTVDNCGAAPAGTYPLQVINVGPALSEAAQEAFDCAVARIGAVIRRPISTVTFPTDQATGPNCFDQTIPGGTSTGGVMIYIKVAPIDGAGRVLGRAGPCFVRNSSRLAVVGLMEFDDADIVNLQTRGTLIPTILHEMLHVIGIGSTWRDEGLASLYTGDVVDPAFLGANAVRACREEHAGQSVCVNRVPVEDCVGIDGCGAGTQFGHWRELMFGTELMTGYLTPPVPPFSRMTIAALSDLGYTVDLEQAEAYTVQYSALFAGVRDASRLSISIRLPEPMRPTHTVDANGRMRPILY